MQRYTVWLSTSKVDITEENLGRNLEELGLSTGEKVTLISDMPKDVSSSISGKIIHLRLN